jgi:metal-responsive CopG/Arc/MetJ family transcriptional regulator
MKVKVSVSLPQDWIDVLDQRAAKNFTSRSAELQNLIRAQFDSARAESSAPVTISQVVNGHRNHVRASAAGKGKK